MEKSEDNRRELEQKNEIGQEEFLRRAYHNKQVKIVKEIISEIIAKLNSGHIPQNCFLSKINDTEYVTVKIFDDSRHEKRGDRAFLLSTGEGCFIHRCDFGLNPVIIGPEDLCRLAGVIQIKTGLISLAKEYFGITIKSHWTNVPR